MYFKHFLFGFSGHLYNFFIHLSQYLLYFLNALAANFLNSSYETNAFALISEIEDLEIKVLYEKNEYLTWPPFNEADLDIYPTLMEVNIKFSEGNFKKILFISGDDIVG